MGFDNILMLYMPLYLYNVSDTVYTYTYRMAFGGGNTNYSLSAASGLFELTCRYCSAGRFQCYP